MKRLLLWSLLITVLSSSVVFAGPPKIGGTWRGDFVAIYPNGDIIPLSDSGEAIITQSDQYPNLFYGTLEFTIDGDTFTRNLTGYISTDKRITANLTDLNELPVGILEGHLTGNTIQGVLRDFTDATTTMFTATRQ